MEINVVSKEDISKVIKQKYCDSALFIGCISFLMLTWIGVMSLFFELRDPTVIVVILFGVLTTSSGFLIHYKKNKESLVLEMEEKQRIALEYNKNPHRFIKSYCGFVEKEKVSSLIENIQKGYYFRRTREGNSPDFESLYLELFSNLKKFKLKRSIEWK